MKLIPNTTRRSLRQKKYFFIRSKSIDLFLDNYFLQINNFNIFNFNIIYGDNFMKVYKIESDDKLIRLNEKKLKLEKDIQKIIEGNLNLIFNLEFIETEFSIKNRRIDTLAYDFETESFVIIEYKRDKSKSIVDQGYAYLGLLLEYQANFVLKYNEIKRANKLINNFDWSQSKIIFIANRFLEYSKEAVGSKMPFELWEISKFEEDILILTKVEPKYSIGIEDVSQGEYTFRLIRTSHLNCGLFL